MRYLSALNSRWDLDAHLHLTASSSQQQQPQSQPQTKAAAIADLIAYTSFLQTTAPPLVALSLYVSSANWAETTRPAFSTLLPFPLTWTEPPALRNRMCDVAAHLGLSDLNIDAAGNENDGTDNDRGFLKIPERLRPRRSRGVRAALSPEQTALFRLEAAAGEGCLAVLEDLKRKGEVDGRRFFFPATTTSPFSFDDDGDGDEDMLLVNKDQTDRPTSLDCLAFAYLALMLVPEVPRPWLRDLMRRKYEGLSLFVDGIRDEIFGGDVEGDLPWNSNPSSSSPCSAAKHQSWILTRFARGALTAIIPGEYLMPREGKQQRLQSNPKQATAAARSKKAVTAALRALGSSVAGAGLVGSVFVYRYMSPFGSWVYRWEVQRRRFGAAGAFFGI